MAKDKYDGVIEAVHYQPDGQVDWVRAYLRRGVVFSDLIKLDRQALVELLRAGKRLVVGRRVAYLGASFEVSAPLRLIQKNGVDVLIAGSGDADKDRLDEVPHI